ncbi:MAG: twin-arginine translocase TatA/TatE family subunit [Phycisphaerales bacterium JB063]
MTAPTLLAFIGPIGWPEMLIIGLIGVLIFGKRLPEVGKSIGKGIVEFKKGLAGVDDEVSDAVKKQKSIEDKPADTTTVETAAHSNAGPSPQS